MRGLPGPHCLPFWSYGAPKFCKIWANPTHSLWRTTFCKMKAVRNYVWKNLTHSLWTRNISILTLRNFFRFSLTHTHTQTSTHTHTHTHTHTRVIHTVMRSRTPIIGSFWSESFSSHRPHIATRGGRGGLVCTTARAELVVVGVGW